MSAFLLLACAGFAEAQTVQGVVTGTIFDSTGAIIPGADVVLTNVGTEINQDAKGNASGEFRFSLVPPGTYKLDIKAAGFTEKQITNIRVDASETVPVNVTLAVASASTTIDVEAAAALVQTASSDLSTTVGLRTIDAMPLLTRNVFDLTFTAPAVTQGMNFNAAAGGRQSAAALP